jgi:hypothetical protein
MVGAHAHHAGGVENATALECVIAGRVPNGKSAARIRAISIAVMVQID